MKKLLLLTGVSAVSLAAFAADSNVPLKFNNAFIQAISPNGKYAVSNLYDTQITIFDIQADKAYTCDAESDTEYFYFGIGKCLSDNGILVGGTTISSAEYWKDGKWNLLPLPAEALFSNSANAITPDGSRICGMLGLNGIAYDDDVTMTVPCIWNADGDGFANPIQLPYPDKDIAGRAPQYVKAIDISGDGKTIIGMITDATGRLNYPILYKEDAEGNWTYELPYLDLLMPKDFTIPDYPGDFNEPYPAGESYLSEKGFQDYQDAINKYYEEGDWSAPMPAEIDFMTDEEKAAYEKDMAEYMSAYEEWQAKFNEWANAYDYIQTYSPGYQNNSVRISVDGLSYGCTTETKEDPDNFWSPSAYHTWIFEINSDKIYKYEQQNNLCLSYLANDNVAIASTPVGGGFGGPIPSNSFILKDGEVTGMYEWMNSKAPEYASWMKENMTFEYEGYDEDYNPVDLKELMTGRGTSNSDLSIISLSVLNIGFLEDDSDWDDPMNIGYSFIFDMKDANAVMEVTPSAEGKIIYDLSGRQLKDATAPGIYIINGKKKVVR